MIDVQGMTDALAEKVELAIDGKLYSGWTEVSVTRSLDMISGQFDLTLASKDRTDAERLQVKPGDRCQLRIAGAVVIDGWVDAVAPSGDRDMHNIVVAGRDRTGDLVDCSAVHKPGSWRRSRIETIAADLVKPFGIKVTAVASTGAPIDRFALQQGESVHSALERLVRFRGLLLVAAPGGNLEIVTPGTGAPIATLQWGKNILGFAATHSMVERFSDYIVKGQASGSDDRNGKTVAQIRGESKDAGVRRYRPLIVLAEDQSDGTSIRTRAAWEAGVRAGKGSAIDIDVLGWRVEAGGELWRPDVRVRVDCPPALLPAQEMLVVGVRLSKGEAGTITTLTCNLPDAWKQQATGSAT